jgi:hypothetical protein
MSQIGDSHAYMWGVSSITTKPWQYQNELDVNVSQVTRVLIFNISNLKVCYFFRFP